MDEETARALFDNAEPERFENRAKLAQELSRICAEGIVHLYVAKGKCVFRPELRVLGSCQVYAKLFMPGGEISCKNYVYEEVPYAQLSFG